MALVPKIDPNKIFASNAPVQDKPAAFDNYEKGMDETRKNNGRPTIKQLNYLHQIADQKVLWIHQNGGGLPYDASIEYAENAATVKDGELKQLVDGTWVELKTKATSITTASNQNQQQINDFGGAKWYAKVGGYELGATVRLANGDIVKSTEPNNTANPNVDMTGWRFDDNTVETIADLIAIQNPKNGQIVYVKSYHAGLNKGGDLFEYKATRQLENDNGNIINGWERRVAPTYLNLLNYGAKGLGLQDDYADHNAFKFVQNVVKTGNKGGYFIHIPYGDYILVKQDFVAGAGFTWEDGLNISFPALTNKRIILRSDNATVSVREGLKYGVFDKNTGQPFTTTMPFYTGTGSWTQDGDKVTIGQFGHLFNFNNIKGLVTQGSLTLNGSRETVVIGGKFGDVDWQLSAYGFRVAFVEKFDISNITSSKHCLDGLYVCGYNSETTPDIYNPEWSGSVRNISCLGNGRQGCSFTGGQNISWYDCNFGDTALPDFNLRSMPRSNFDIEAELIPIRNARFYNCNFGHSGAPSLVADSADSRDVHFYSCKFINAIGSVMWVRKPEFKFFNCYFNGHMEGQYLTNIHSDRTVYESCTFTDDPKINPSLPSGRLYLIDAYGANPIFNNCTYNIYRRGMLYLASGNDHPAELNNALFNLYETANDNSAHTGIFTVKIRDYRTTKTSFVPTFYSQSPNSIIVVENVDGLANVTPYTDASVNIVNKILPTSNAYNLVGVAVTNATGTDDTSIKLNALIASLKAANYIA